MPARNAILALSMILAGCASAPPATLQPPSVLATQTPRTLTFELGPMLVGERPTGTVVIDISGTGYRMTLTVEGLTPNGHYPVNLHPGHCPGPDTTSASWVDQDIQANANGAIHFVKTYNHPWSIPTLGQVLTVHGRLPVADRTYIGCAEFKN